LLFHAALSGDISLLEFLVEQGNTQAASEALHLAAARGDMALAEWFLARGADVTTRNFQNRTALQVAEASGQEEVAALLRQYGATE
jgi:hypothetical protein